MINAIIVQEEHTAVLIETGERLWWEFVSDV